MEGPQTVWFEIFLVLLLILANGVFALSEIAILSSRKVRLTKLSEEGNNRATVALELYNEPTQFLSAIQVGITLIGIVTGAYGVRKSLFVEIRYEFVSMRGMRGEHYV